MDSREQRADASAANWASNLALFAVLVFGFHDFPQHGGLIASAALLVHIAGESTSAQSRLVGRQREISAWLETLTLRIGLVDLAQRIIDKNPPPAFEEFDDPEQEYWRQHQRDAVADIKHDQERRQDMEKFGFNVKPSMWLGLLSYAVVYGLYIGAAAFVAALVG